jgi:hypothetical protein
VAAGLKDHGRREERRGRLSALFELGRLSLI